MRSFFCPEEKLFYFYQTLFLGPISMHTKFGSFISNPFTDYKEQTILVIIKTDFTSMRVSIGCKLYIILFLVESV